jgi:tetrahydromethanopterin S-methyltransferase subunit A
MQITNNRVVTETRTIEYDFISGSDKYVEYTDTIFSTILENGVERQEKKSVVGATSIENIKLATGFNRIKNALEEEHNACILSLSKENYARIMKAEDLLQDCVEKFTTSADYIPIIYDVASYTAKDLQGNYIAVPIFFSSIYSQGRIRSSEYDLKGITEHLKDNTRVLWLKSAYIPEYNQDIDGETELLFYYVPTLEEYTKYITDDKNISYIRDEILGLDKFKLNRA